MRFLRSSHSIDDVFIQDTVIKIYGTICGGQFTVQKVKEIKTTPPKTTTNVLGNPKRKYSKNVRRCHFLARSATIRFACREEEQQVPSVTSV
jgi:hypothetical protein